LCLRQIFGVAQTRSGKIHISEIGAGEIRVIKFGIAQICSSEIRVVKPRMNKIGTGQISRLEIAGRQRRETQKGVLQACCL